MSGVSGSSATAGWGSECQIGGGVYVPFSRPWRGDERQVAKERIFRYIRYESHGVPFSKVVTDVFGAQAVSSSGADYQLARRFVIGSDLFKTQRRDGVLWVQPTLEVFNLSQQKAKGKTSGQRGGEVSNGETGDETRKDVTGLPDETGRAGAPTYAKGRVKRYLSNHVEVRAESNKRWLLEELSTYRDSIADKFSIFRHRLRDDFLLLPYRTRFNDIQRALDVRDGFESALEVAAESHDNAVVLTLTSDPKRFESHSGALESLAENKQRLMSWLATENQLGYRPDNLRVLEFDRAGKPHAHIVLFGIRWAISQESLSAYWDDKGQGRVVDIRGVTKQGNEWVFSKSGVSLKYYLGKAIRELVDVAGMSESGLREAVASGDIDLWRQALYWATERQYYSCSPCLKESTEGDTLPHVTTWIYEGTARYQDIPAYVRENTVSGTKPPPTKSESATNATAG